MASIYVPLMLFWIDDMLGYFYYVDADLHTCWDKN